MAQRLRHATSGPRNRVWSEFLCVLAPYCERLGLGYISAIPGRVLSAACGLPSPAASGSGTGSRRYGVHADPRGANELRCGLTYAVRSVSRPFPFEAHVRQELSKPLGLHLDPNLRAQKDTHRRHLERTRFANTPRDEGDCLGVTRAIPRRAVRRRDSVSSQGSACKEH